MSTNITQLGRQQEANEKIVVWENYPITERNSIPVSSPAEF